METAPAPSWKHQRERSMPWLVQLIVWIAQHAGRRFARLLLWPISAYFLLTSPQVRRESRRFLQRVLPQPPRWTDTFRQIFNFASCVLDRVFLLTGRDQEFDIQVSGGGSGLQYAGAGQAAILLTAHRAASTCCAWCSRAAAKSSCGS